MSIANIIKRYIDMGINIELGQNNQLEIEAPEGILTKNIINEIKQYKKEIILFFSNRDSIASRCNIQKINNKNEEYKLSNAQKRLWILDQFEEVSIAYNMPSALILEGGIVTDFFNKAYSFMLERHESLRTIFITVDGEARQKIINNPEYRIELVDLRDCIDSEKEARALAEKDILTPFQLETGPLVRFSIVRIEDKKHLLLFNMHHIISDGWSMNIFIREFLYCYNSFKEGNTPDLKPLRIQYKDYSVWQNDLHESDEINLQKSYWLDKLSGEIPVLDLPSDKVRPAIQTFNGNSIGFNLSKETSSALNKLCQENQVSMFMMLHALVKVLFHRYTGQNDIILGSPVAGRVHEDFEGQIGFYVNTLVLRDTITSYLSFNRILEEVGKTCTDAFDNQIYPFDRLVEDLDIKRDLSRSPLIDVMLVLQNNEDTEIEFDGLNLTPFESENLISKFDMTLYFKESDGVLFCSIEYNTDIYSEDRITRMIEHFRTLSSSVIENPETMVQDFEIIPGKEKHLLLNVFNDTKTDYPSDKTIIDLIEGQVEKTPDNIAVVFEDVKLTYKELNGKANIVGHYLRDNYNIKPDDLVGVMLKRSEKMIITLLGILKSGAAYVPIDPEYPQERIDYMLEDSNPKLVLSESSTDSRNRIDIINIHEILKSNKSINNLSMITNPGNLAYVVYTSGSTGKPKGALIENRNVVRLFFNEKFQFDFSDNDVWSIFHSFCFDFSVWEMYGALFFGGKAVIISKETARDPEEFCKLLLTNKITVLNQTPTAFANLSEVVSHKKQALSVRYVIFGGEALNPSKLRFWYNTFSDCKLINMFGITETTVHVTYKEITEDEICNNISNIGKPIPTLTTYVLDRNQNLLPIGVIGEICVAGEGVCRGYLNNKELTSLKFIENPFNKDEILYRSGDKAFINSLGELVYLGRFDNQIQLRGFRVELGEIENSLLQHTDINSVVVILYQYMTGDKDLTAYYVSGREFDISEIRAYLKLTLPDYMIPSYFVRMNLLPLNSNGKIDKKILPDPKVNGVVNNLEIIAPRNEIEEELVNIWKDILGIKSIGIEDDFFNLGGNSLKAVTMVYKIKKVFNDKEIPLIDFYKNPVIKNLSELISGNSENDLTIIKAIKKNNNSEINLICIPYAGADASIYFNLAEDISKLTEKISIYGINSISNNLDGDGDGDGARLQDIKTLANNCFNEINGNIKGPIIIYGHCIGSALSVEISHLLEEADMEVKALCLGASIPLRRRSMKRQNPMLKMSDYDIYEILKEWGLPDIELDAEDLSYLIRNFKKDIKMYRDYGIIKRKWKLNIPLYCIVSKDDPLTIGYKRKYKNWETYTTNNITLIELEDCSHYFINEIPETLAGLLVDISRQ